MITHKFRFTLSCSSLRDENYNEILEKSRRGGWGKVVFVVSGGEG